MKTITLTDEQYQALLNGESVTIKPHKKEIKKWEPKGGKWFITSYGEVLYVTPDVESRLFGMSYPTKEQAEKARDAMRSHNRLLAWLAENDDGWVADWKNSKQLKYYVYYWQIGKTWMIHGDSEGCGLCQVYMSEQNAEKLRDLLNDGSIKL